MDKEAKNSMYGMFTILYDERHGCYINAGSNYTKEKKYPKDQEKNHPKTHYKDITHEE